MILYYLRHGDPIYSPDSLTEQGMMQAQALSKRLAVYGLDKVYASTSNRALLTAKPTAKLLGREITRLDWANENHLFKDLAIDRGDGYVTWCFACKNVIDLFASGQLNHLGKRWYTHEAFAKYNFKRALETVENGTYSFLEALGYKHDEKRGGYIPVAPNDFKVALFAHQGVGLTFLSYLLDIPFPTMTTRFDMGHSGMTVIEFGGTSGLVVPKVLQLSSDAHLYKEGMPLVYQNRIKF